MQDFPVVVFWNLHIVPSSACRPHGSAHSWSENDQMFWCFPQPLFKTSISLFVCVFRKALMCIDSKCLQSSIFHWLWRCISLIGPVWNVSVDTLKGRGKKEVWCQICCETRFIQVCTDNTILFACYHSWFEVSSGLRGRCIIQQNVS